MTKIFTSLRLAVLAALSVSTSSLLGGCELYFGDSGGGDYSYCGSDGYYVCSNGGECEWAGATCPDGTGPGFACESSADCAAGCFCGTSNTCEEGGFCTSDEDCGDGTHCNVDRQSCEPNTCSTNDDCDVGSICNNGTCEATCACGSDAEAMAGGFGYCDETRGTCMPGTDPAGSCAGEVTCNTKAPTCADGEVPLILDGCFTGSCRAIAQCDATPACANLQHENDCLGRASGTGADCSAVYTGINCTKQDGTACQAGDTGCTCADFRFNSCTTRQPGGKKVLKSSFGGYQSFEAMFH